jgi:hypothetical protein
MDDRVRDPDLPDVVEHCRELGALSSTCVETQLVSDRCDEVDDVAAVASRVVVVCLDDVAEQKGCAAIGVRELEDAVETCCPLSRKDAQQDEQGQREHEGRWPNDGGGCRQEADRRQQSVDGEDPPVGIQDFPHGRSRRE